MSLEPKITLILPIFPVPESSDKLRACLDALLAQTLEELEIVCLDFSSDEGISDLLNEYILKDTRILPCRNTNTSLSDALNCSLDKAKGNYLSVLDIKFAPSRDFYETIYQKARNNDLDFLKTVNTQNTNRDIAFNKVLTDLSGKQICELPFRGIGLYKSEFVKTLNIKIAQLQSCGFSARFFDFLVLVNAHRAMFLKGPCIVKNESENIALETNDEIFAINKEFCAMENYLDEHKEKKHFYPLFYYKKFLAYMENFDKIKSNCRLLFLIKMKFEFMKSQRKKNLDACCFKKSERKKLWQIMTCPIVFMLKLKYNNLMELKNMDKSFLNYFEEVKAQKQINKLAKKYKDKRVVIYGAGLYTKTLFENFDMSKLKIAAIADKSFEKEENKNFFGLKCISPGELRSFECDVILIGVKEKLAILDFLEDELLPCTVNDKVKFRPLIGKTLCYVLKEYYKSLI